MATRPQPDGKPRPPGPAPAYSVRRDEPTRLEGFSDAVFGFSLTLLAFSLEVPSNVEELRLLAVAQLVPTIGAFALMCWIWAEHNSFFRQFGLQDGTTVVLNCALLFLVVFYTYPLKFMAVFLWALIADRAGWNGIVDGIAASGSLQLGTTGGAEDFAPLMLIYNLGFLALFGVFALLYRHALNQRDVLALDEIETFDAHAGRRVHLTSLTVGLVAMATFVLFWAVDQKRLIGLSGMVYMFMGPAHGILGARNARARARLLASRAPQPVLEASSA